MTEAGKRLARIIKELKKIIRPGIATKEIDRVAETLVFKHGGTCSFKGYEGFPSCLCSSINEEIVHSVPSKRSLKDGDIISLDLGILYKGFHSDMAVTLGVGKISPKAKKLIRVTKNALEQGIKKARPGNTFGDISKAIQQYVESSGFNVVRNLCGHGIGRDLHEEPQILNYVFPGQEADQKIEPGMVFCLEPMVTAGDWKTKKGKDGFGYVTDDNSLSAHFEHMIAITKNGPRVLTRL